MAPSGTDLLRGPDNVGRLAMYPDGAVYAHINDLAAIVWPQKNFRASVKRKASKAHDAGNVARVPPMADFIIVEIDRVEEYLTLWAHRDAHEALAAFDLAAWRQRAYRVLAIYADREKAKIRDQIAGMRATYVHWAGREAEFQALANE